MRSKYRIAIITITTAIILSNIIFVVNCNTELMNDEKDDLLFIDLSNLQNMEEPNGFFDIINIFNGGIEMKYVNDPNCVDVVKFSYNNDAENFSLIIEVEDLDDKPENSDMFGMIQLNNSDVSMSISFLMGDGFFIESSNYSSSGEIETDIGNNEIRLNDISDNATNHNNIEDFDYIGILGVGDMGEEMPSKATLDQFNNKGYTWDDILSEYFGDNPMFSWWFGITDYFRESFSDNIFSITHGVWFLLPDLIAIIMLPTILAVLVKLLIDRKKMLKQNKRILDLSIIGLASFQILVSIVYGLTMDYSEILSVVNLIHIMLVSIWVCNNVADYFISIKDFNNRNWLIFTGLGLIGFLTTPIVLITSFIKSFGFSSQMIGLLVSMIILIVSVVAVIKISELFSFENISKTKTK